MTTGTLSLTVREAYDAFLLSRQAMGCTHSTYHTYRRELLDVLRDIMDEDLASIRPERLQHCLAQVYSRGIAKQTMASYRSRVAALINWCTLMGYCQEGLMRPVPKVRVGRSIRRIHSEDELRALLEYARLTPHPYWAASNVALILLLIDTGMRIGELCNLNIEDLAPTGRVKVRGKGDRERYVRVSPATLDTLARYLKMKEPFRPGEPLFLTRVGVRVTPTGIYQRLRHLGDRIGIHVNPHKFRHTFAKMALSNGANIKDLQIFLGHSQLQTTDNYLSGFGNEQAIEDHEKFSPVRAMALMMQH